MRKIFKTISEALNGEEKDFTSGSINRAIVLLSIPMVLEMIMESLFAVADVFFVSRVSVDAVATVGLTESVVTLVYAIAVGMSMAATAMVARRVGEKKPEEAAVAAAQSMLIALAVSIALAVPGFLYAEDILRLMGGSEELIANGVGYTRILLGSNAVIFFLFLLNAIFRGAGDAAIAMRSLWLANGINIILDPLFIFGIGPFPEMGVQGAAVATLIGRGTGVLYQLYMLFGRSGVIQLRWEHFRVHLAIIRKLADVASTGAGQFLIGSASWIFLMRIIAHSGSEAVAGYTIAIRLLLFTILPSWGLANAAATLVGQNLGAGQPERAERSVWQSAWYNMLFLVSVSVIYFVFAHPILGLFKPEPEVLEAGVLSLRIICAGYVFFAYGMVVSQAFNGAGDTRTPTLINLFCFWMLEIPVAYFLAVAMGWGLAGVCWAIAGSEAVLAAICVLVFRMGRWKTVEV
ncbi:MAG: MATE family efflux transporter [Lewinellaceae bacterium]|nr:MATE family efflux transporter [Phaeodactylibacter sp.]MCB9039689.1 MATE family efflux transporter [Lewinellaceae bacterium]